METAKYLQFTRAIPTAGGPRQVKLDLLTGPPRPGADLRRIRMDRRRWRPRGARIPLHAHPAPEAVAREDALIEEPACGRRTTGEACSGSVFLPHPFTYALMKLFAFYDRRDDPDKDLGRHHALDLYTILASMTEPEWELALRLGELHREHRVLRAARSIVRTWFPDAEAPGTLRLREHPLFSEALDLPGFLDALGELLHAGAGPTAAPDPA